MSVIYERGSFRPRESIGQLVGDMRKAIIGAVERELAALDISAAQIGVIVYLFEDGSGTAADLCKSMSYDPGAMTRLIDRLEKKKFVRRVRATDSRRAVRLELTAAGRSLYPQIVDGLVRAFNALLRGFSRTEVRQFESLARRMLENA